MNIKYLIPSLLLILFLMACVSASASPQLPGTVHAASEFLLRDTSRSHQWGNRLLNLGRYLAPGYTSHLAYASFTYRF